METAESNDRLQKLFESRRYGRSLRTDGATFVLAIGIVWVAGYPLPTAIREVALFLMAPPRSQPVYVVSTARRRAIAMTIDLHYFATVAMRVCEDERRKSKRCYKQH
jgi:hypothetical protein